MSLGGLFINPDISPWVETALVIAQRNAAATTVAMAAMALTFGGDVSMSRTVADRLDFAAGDSLMLTDTGQFQFGTAGAADVQLSRPFASSMQWGSTPASAVTVTGFSITPGAHTALPAGIEASDFSADLNRIVQFAAGALATQRAFRILAPTYGFVAASVLSDAATLHIDNAPIPGANATITRSYTAWLAREDGTNSTVLPVMRLQRTTSNVAFGATGIGGGIDFWSEDAAGTLAQAGTFAGIFADATAVTREGGFTFTAPRSTDQAMTEICRFRGGDVNGPYAFFGATGTVSASRYRFASGRFAIDYTSTLAVIIGPSGLASTSFAFDTTNHQLLAISTTSATVPRFSQSGNTTSGLGFPAATTTALLTNSLVRVYCASDGAVAIGSALAPSATSALSGWLDLQQVAQTSGLPKLLRADGATHTNTTASTEIIDVDFALARTVQKATGDYALQRAFVVRPPAYSAVGVTRIDDAATFAVSGPPTASTNMTLDRAWTIWGQTGASRFTEVASDSFVEKSADETVSLDVALTADSKLKRALLLDGLYYFRFVFGVRSDPTPDFKFTIAGSGGLTATRVRWTFTAIELTGTPTLLDADVFTTLGGGPQVIAVTTSAVDTQIVVEGSIKVSAAGTLELQWAQNTSNAANTTVRGGSTLEILRCIDT